MLSIIDPPLMVLDNPSLGVDLDIFAYCFGGKNPHFNQYLILLALVSDLGVPRVERNLC